MKNSELIVHLMMQRTELVSHIKKLKEKHGDLIDNTELHTNMINGSYKFLEENFDKIHKHVDKNVLLPLIKESIYKI